MNSNDLSSYYRRIKKYISLPSGTSYYNDNVIAFTENGEVGIRSMTSDDEVILKNPDALLNGEAIKAVLNSCVDGLKKPESLLTNDVDVLLTAIRAISYGKSDFHVTCPECSHEMSFAVDMEAMLDTTQRLEENYYVKLESGLIVYVRPFVYTDRVKMLRVAFEQEKIKAELVSSNSPEDTLKIMSKSIKDMTALNSQLICNSIYRLVDEDNDLDLTVSTETAKDILALIHNLQLEDVNIIEAKVKEVNDIGMDKNINVICEECSHQWKSGIETNPVNFSLGS